MDATLSLQTFGCWTRELYWDVRYAVIDRLWRLPARCVVLASGDSRFSIFVNNCTRYCLQTSHRLVSATFSGMLCLCAFSPTRQRAAMPHKRCRTQHSTDIPHFRGISRANCLRLFLDMTSVRETGQQRCWFVCCHANARLVWLSLVRRTMKQQKAQCAMSLVGVKSELEGGGV